MFQPLGNTGGGVSSVGLKTAIQSPPFTAGTAAGDKDCDLLLSSIMTCNGRSGYVLGCVHLSVCDNSRNNEQAFLQNRFYMWVRTHKSDSILEKNQIIF